MENQNHKINQSVHAGGENPENDKTRCDRSPRDPERLGAQLHVFRIPHDQLNLAPGAPGNQTLNTRAHSPLGHGGVIGIIAGTCHLLTPYPTHITCQQYIT